MFMPAAILHLLLFNPSERDPLVQLINRNLFDLGDGLVQAIRKRDEIKAKRIVP